MVTNYINKLKKPKYLRPFVVYRYKSPGCCNVSVIDIKFFQVIMEFLRLCYV